MSKVLCCAQRRNASLLASSATGRAYGGQSGVKLDLIPTVLRDGPYRVFFFSADRGEPPHVHVTREAKEANFWLSPVRLQDSGGFSTSEINRLTKLVEEHQQYLLREWHAFFNLKRTGSPGAGGPRHG